MSPLTQGHGERVGATEVTAGGGRPAILQVDVLLPEAATLSVSERSPDCSAGARLTGAVLLRLTGALLALAAGAAAVVIVIVLVRSVLSI